MQSARDIQRIGELLDATSREVRNLYKASFTDIGRAGQSVLCSILSIAYDLPQLENLDAARANFPAIDLADRRSGIAFQVTGDNSIEKIRDTLTKFFRHNLDDDFNSLKFFFLTSRLPSYGSVASFVQRGFDFKLGRDLMDAGTFMRQVSGIDPGKRHQILDILEAEHGERGLAKRAISTDELEKAGRVFVAPRGFEEAAASLEKNAFLILAGPPHVGKTTTALMLLDRMRQSEVGTRILDLSAEDALDLASRLNGEFLRVDDAFGQFEFEKHVAANNIGRLLSLARRNKVVLTSRNTILEAAGAKSRLRETLSEHEHVFRLEQEGSYFDEQLALIYQNHIEARLSDTDDEFDQTCADELMKYGEAVVQRLRFPHNIAFFVQHAPVSALDWREAERLIDNANKVRESAVTWFENLDQEGRLLVALTALFPELTESALISIRNDLGLNQVNDRLLARSSGGFLKWTTKLQIAHPSYREGVVQALGSDHRFEASKVLRSVARAADSLSFHRLLPIALAVRLLERGVSPWDTVLQPAPTDPKEFYFRYIRAYNGLINTDFPALRLWFDPHEEEACIHLYRNAQSRVTGWSIVPKLAEGESLTESFEDSGTARTSVAMKLLELGKDSPVVHCYSKHEVALPEVDAFEEVTKCLLGMLQSAREFPAGFTMAHAELERDLRSCKFPIAEITALRPLTAQWLRDWSSPMTDASSFEERLLAINKMGIRGRVVEGRINDLDLDQAVELLEVMSAEGYVIDAPFLVPQDCPWDRPVYHSPRSRIENWYTDEQLERAVATALYRRFVAIQEIISTCFPTLSARIGISVPDQIVVVINRSPVNWWEDAHILWTGRGSRSDGDPRGITFEVHTISPHRNEESNLSCLALRDSITQSERFSGGSVESFTQIDRWREHVLHTVRSRFEAFLSAEEDCLFLD